MKEVIHEVPAKPDPVILKVYNPSGAFEVAPLFAPRLGDLAGKTICELWNRSWEGQATFPEIDVWLQKQFPTLKIIPYTEFPVGKAEIDNDKTAQLVKSMGCDAVITGNAG
ncbi:hypothetical protein ACFLV0_05080 [Chloroflexota bacterium]